jgi:hypothetical protein
MARIPCYAARGITKSVFGLAARRTSGAVEAGWWGRAGKAKTCWTEPPASEQLWGLLSSASRPVCASCRPSSRSCSCYGGRDGVLRCVGRRLQSLLTLVEALRGRARERYRPLRHALSGAEIGVTGRNVRNEGDWGRVTRRHELSHHIGGRGGGCGRIRPQVSIGSPQQGQTSTSWPLSSRRRSCQRRG